MKEFSKSRAAAFFILLSVLASGCAGSGAGSAAAPRFSGPGPAEIGISVPAEPGEISSGAAYTLRFYEPDPPDTGRQEVETNPYLLPAIAVPDPGSDASLSDLPPARAFDRSWLVTPVNPCHDFFGDYVNRRANSMEPCNRARIPGLTPLYNMVSANVAARTAAGESFPEIGVVIDMDDHGDRVVDTAAIAAPRELFRYVDTNSNHKSVVVEKFEALENAGGLVENPIVNISQGNLFTTNPPPFIDPNFLHNFIEYTDVRRAGALLVVSAGNYGPEKPVRYTTYSDGTRIRTDGPNAVINPSLQPNTAFAELRTTPEQPAHNPDALRQIHEETGSLLLVAGLQWNVVLPLTDENGFHLRYTNEGSPVIHGNSNRCGDAKDYCVTAPYRIFDSVRVLGQVGNIVSITPSGYQGTSYSAPLVFGTLVNIRYVWPHLTNRQLVKLSCATAIDRGKRGNDPVYGCGQFSVSDIWQPTGELVDNPDELFSLSIADGAMSVGGASFGEEVKVVGYENNEFRRDYELSVPASYSGEPLRIEPTVSYGSLRTMLRFRGNGSVPVGYEGTAAHLFKDAFLFLKGVQGGSAVGVSHASGFSVAFERETDSFFGSYGSGSYRFGDTNKVVASFDREFDLNGTYGLGVKVAAAYGEMEPAISLVKSAKGTAKSAGVSLARRKGNFESRVEMNYNTGLKGTVSIQRREYDLKPLSEAAFMLKMRFVM